MARIFVISDLHLGHQNILFFKKEGGHPLREFNSLDEMHGAIINRWCQTVKSEDHVYVLGDICFDRKYLEIFNGLPGHKRLVLGNHDLFNIQVYAKYFEKIFGVRQLNGVWLTHTPMHEDSVNAPGVVCNVHGHLHSKIINHPKYVNVCVEQINYTPVDLETIRARFPRE